MKIHSNVLSAADANRAAREAGVTLTKCEGKGSRSHSGALDVSLAGSSPRRTMDGQDYAATWDEWGMFIANIYSLDPKAVFKGMGSYDSAEHFHRVTGGRFQSLTPASQHRVHKWEPCGRVGGHYLHSCNCGATFLR